MVRMYRIKVLTKNNICRLQPYSILTSFVDVETLSN